MVNLFGDLRKICKDDDLAHRLEFYAEMDGLKQVFRRTYLIDKSRTENSVEHSWHMAIAVMVLADYADEPIDRGRAIIMTLIHEFPELLVGDTYAHDKTVDWEEVAASEAMAVVKMLDALPWVDLSNEMFAIWKEFEDMSTPTAKFVNLLDSLLPSLHNFLTEGKLWQETGVTSTDALRRIDKKVPDGGNSQRLRDVLHALIGASVALGYLPE